jgi:hypothetical protein
MPVEIRELVIRAVVQADSKRPEVASAQSSTPEAQQALIEAAVREVLRILKTARER